jgi:hypothetical protein
LRANDIDLAVGANTEYPWGARDDEGHLAVRWPEAHLTRRFWAAR